MRRTTLALLLILAVGIAIGAAWWVLDRPGAASVASGRDANREIAVQPFRRISVDGLAEVQLVEGAREAVVVAAPKGAPGVGVDVRGDTLFVTAPETRRWWQWLGPGGNRTPRVTITFRELQGLRLAGAVRLRAAAVRSPELSIAASGATSVRIDQLDADVLKLSGAGAIKAEFAGHAREQRIGLSGAGVFRGAELAGDHVRVSVSGAGKAAVRAAQTLDVAISGAGSVEYSGDPTVTQRISGAGKIRRRSAGDGDGGAAWRGLANARPDAWATGAAHRSGLSVVAVARRRESSPA